MQIKVKFVSISVLIIILYVCFIFYVFFFYSFYDRYVLFYSQKNHLCYGGNKILPLFIGGSFCKIKGVGALEKSAFLAKDWL